MCVDVHAMPYAMQDSTLLVDISLRFSIVLVVHDSNCSFGFHLRDILVSSRIVPLLSLVLFHYPLRVRPGSPLSFPFLHPLSFIVYV